MPIAFFDLDRTLLSRNSGNLWVRAELREGHISWWQGLRASFFLARYHLGLTGLEAALSEAIGSLSGKDEASIRERTQRFYEREIAGLYRPGGRQAVRRHLEAGDHLALLTSSSNYLSEPVLAELGLHEALCNRFEVDETGRFTGRSQGVLAFGEGKLTLARECAERRGVRLADCAFYTDSLSDLPVMEVVGQPVAVNPDPRLRRLAQQRGWSIQDWGDPPSTP